MPRKAKLLPFRPRNMVEQPGEVEQIGWWGPNLDRPPLIACNVDWRDGPGGLRAIFTLQVPPWHVWLASCRLMQWGGGERVLLPDQSWTTRSGKRTYQEVIFFDSNDEQRWFEEAALRSIRLARRNNVSIVPGAQTVVEAPQRSDDVPF